jgi:hypothetical protein
MKEHRPHFFTHGIPARLAGADNCVSEQLEAMLKQVCLRRLAGTIRSFKGD